MGLRDLFATLQIKRHMGRIDNIPISFPADLLKPRHILVCLPEGLRELTLVKQFLPAISGLFKPADISLLAMPGIKVYDIYPRKGFQILTPSVDQLTWSGLPKKTYLKTLTDQKFDMVLDLNFQSSFFTSSILLNFPTAVRIGRGNHLGRPFYNLEIKTKYLRDERNIYRSLLETLGTVMNKPVDGATAHTAN
ncbi:MAG: hypothetical protein DRP45_11995 [Candidatus Zixiibacteriota bacterium]|nr:MAG: hypothetical protein DRP45_11995 [candidate division Zixibacteria bacterium]